MNKKDLIKEIERVLNNTSTYEASVQAESIFQFLESTDLLKQIKDDHFTKNEPENNQDQN